MSREHPEFGRWTALLGALVLLGCGDTSGTAKHEPSSMGGASDSSGIGGSGSGGSGKVAPGETGGRDSVSTNLGGAPVTAGTHSGGSSSTNLGGAPVTAGTHSGGSSSTNLGGAPVTAGTHSGGSSSTNLGGAPVTAGTHNGGSSSTNLGGAPVTAGTHSGGSSSTNLGGAPVTGGTSSGGTSSTDLGGAPVTGGTNSGGAETAGTAGTSAGGAETCDLSAPPGEVADWIEESWNAEGKNNINWYSNWLFDAAMMGQGKVNVCVRYGATTPVTTQMRDAWGPALEELFNTWFGLLHPYACFPYERVEVRISGWSVRPGQESLLQWSDDSVPIYTEVSDGSDQAEGEPKCPDACGFFFEENWDHSFANCPGGFQNHFDYSLWLDDTGPAGAAAHGSAWGIRMAASGFASDIESKNTFVEWHEIGHAFGLSDYYSWTGSTPQGGSVMIMSSGAESPSLGDQWMLRRYFREARALRYPY